MEQHEEGDQKVHVNTQQSGGTGRNSLWIECHQFAPSLDRNSGLLIPSNSTGGSVAQSLSLFSQQGQQSKKENKTKQTTSRAPVTTRQALLDLGSSSWQIWSPWLRLHGAIPAQTVAKTFPNSNPGHFMLSQNFKLVSSSCFFPSFLLRKAPYHHTSKILLRYVQI